jgi:proteasome accessory factor C
MSADAGTRLQRILSALPTIVGRGAVSLDEVRDAVGVDAPTLLDDLRALTERDDEPGGFVEAVHILFEPDRVSIRSPHFARPTRITLPELCALELGLAMLAASAAPGERAPIDGARAKIRAAIVALPESAARDDLWYASGPSLANEAALDALRAAATELRKVRMVYRRGDSSESTERTVHPYVVVPVRGKWFLVAHCERTEAMRFFRVDRIQNLEPTADSFARPADVASISGVSGALVSAASERLVVRYSPAIARWIAEREDGEPAPDGSLVVSHPLADDAWAVRHVLQYGPEAEVLEPARVREKVLAVLERMHATLDDRPR